MSRILVLLLLFSGPLFSQEKGGAAGEDIPRFTLKTNLTTLANPFKQALAFSADFRMASRFSVDVGAGYFFNSVIFAEYKGESYRGLRLRAGMKYYYRVRENAAFHIGAELKHNAITHSSFQNALRQGGQYVEMLLADRKVNTYGAAVRVGAQFFGKTNKRLFMEPYLGLGYSGHQVSVSLPPDAELLGEEDFFSFEYPLGKSWVPDLLLGVYLGYAF